MTSRMIHVLNGHTTLGNSLISHLVVRYSASKGKKHEHSLEKTASIFNVNLLIFQIVVIQACQTYKDVPNNRNRYFDAMSAEPNEEKHIVLTRPNTLLLMSTVTGGNSIRGVFTGALADQIATADGKKSIEDMQAQARVEMQSYRHQLYHMQIPEMRSTLMKRLVLPPAENATQ